MCGVGQNYIPTVSIQIDFHIFHTRPLTYFTVTLTYLLMTPATEYACNGFLAFTDPKHLHHNCDIIAYDLWECGH